MKLNVEKLLVVFVLKRQLLRQTAGQVDGCNRLAGTGRFMVGVASKRRWEPAVDV